MDSTKDSESLEYGSTRDKNSEESCVNQCSTDNAESLQRMSYKEKRKEKRSKSKINDTTLKSLQPLSGSDNLSLINDLLTRTKSERKRQKLTGLRAILEDLLAPDDSGGLPSSIMSFER